MVLCMALLGFFFPGSSAEGGDPLNRILGT